MRKSNLVRSVDLAFGEDIRCLLKRFIIEEGHSVAQVTEMIQEHGILVGETTLYRWLKKLGYRLEWGKGSGDND